MYGNIPSIIGVSTCKMVEAVNESEATELESDNELLTSDTELEAELSSTVSLLDKLKPPRLSDLSRKRVTKKILCII